MALQGCQLGGQARAEPTSGVTPRPDCGIGAGQEATRNAGKWVDGARQVLEDSCLPLGPASAPGVLAGHSGVCCLDPPPREAKYGPGSHCTATPRGLAIGAGLGQPQREPGRPHRQPICLWARCSGGVPNCPGVSRPQSKTALPHQLRPQAHSDGTPSCELVPPAAPEGFWGRPRVGHCGLGPGRVCAVLRLLSVGDRGDPRGPQVLWGMVTGSS